MKVSIGIMSKSNECMNEWEPVRQLKEMGIEERMRKIEESFRHCSIHEADQRLTFVSYSVD